MGKLDDFILIVKNLLEPKEKNYEIQRVGEKRFYFCNDYAKDLEQFYNHPEDVKCHEFQPILSYPNIKICSVTSSARLCFLKLYGKDTLFEAALKNPVGEDRYPAQLDARVKNTFYESKCQEVINGEGELLKESYKKLLEDEFAIKNIKINQYDNTLSFNLRDMGADYDEDYDKTHFNVKQLFTHLLAIAKSNEKEPVTLKYIIFKPSDRLLKDYPELLKVYSDLKNEIKAIKESDSIKIFLRRHEGKISLDLDDVFVEIDDLRTLSEIMEKERK